MMNQPHLDGRFPHREIAKLLEDARKARTVEDIVALKNHVAYISSLARSLVSEFCASVPAAEKKRKGIDIPPKKPRVDPNGVALAGLEDDQTHKEINQRLKEWTFQQWKDTPMHTYDDRASAVISLLQHDRLDIVRQLVDAGVDLVQLRTQCCHVGGGLNLLNELLPIYIWTNQLLMHEPGPWALKSMEPTTAEERQLLAADPRGAVRLQALRWLKEGTDAYDNRNFRFFPATRELGRQLGSQAGVSTAGLKEYVKTNVFPTIYRAAHVLLYNEIRHRGLAVGELTRVEEHRRGSDRLKQAVGKKGTKGGRNSSSNSSGKVTSNSRGSAAAEPPKQPLHIEHAVQQALYAALRGLVRPIEGVKRDQVFGGYIY